MLQEKGIWIVYLIQQAKDKNIDKKEEIETALQSGELLLYPYMDGWLMVAKTQPIKNSITELLEKIKTENVEGKLWFIAKARNYLNLTMSHLKTIITA